MLFFGIAAYGSEGDPIVREQLENKKHQLAHWAKFYGVGKIFMPLIALGGTVAAGAAYAKTKENLWLIGGATLISIIPFTFIVMKKTNDRLNAILDNCKDPELGEAEKEEVTSSFKRWINMHRGRVALALGAAGLFFAAKSVTKS